MTEPGWPDDWADRMAGKGCPMCATLGKGDNDFSVEVFTGEVADVYLERRSRLPGYCIVIGTATTPRLAGRSAGRTFSCPTRYPTRSCTPRPRTSASCWVRRRGPRNGGGSRRLCSR